MIRFLSLNRVFLIVFQLMIGCFLSSSYMLFAQQPKLVVGIVVDQMRYDYIDRYWEKFGNEGFKRLVKEGFFCKNTHYNYVPTYTAPGHASVYTGTSPSVHGIIANNWFDKETNTFVYCTEDKTVSAIGGSEKSGQMSPERLFTTTLGDQLKLSDNFQSKVIGIALKDRGAILPAGHSADAAYWYDGITGNWMSSTFYLKELPEWVKEFNKRELPRHYLENTWNTLLPLEQYSESTKDDNPYEKLYAGLSRPVFPYNLKDLMPANEQLNLLRSTPFGNSITKDFAIATIKSENMGKGNSTDLLAISFSSTDYIGHQFGPNSIETEDAYLRLDRDLAELLKFLDEWVGRDQVLLFLTADHGAAENATFLREHRIPAGSFNDAQLIKKTKSFLYAMYHDSLVLSVSNQQVFLNHTMIAEQKLKMEDVENTLVDFLLKEKGVENVFTSFNITNWGMTEGLKARIQNGFNQKRSGDLMINYFPYWTDNQSTTGTTHGSPYEYDTHVPLIFYGNGIKTGSTNDPIDITDIATTICNLLNIQEPNGCSGKVINELKNR